MLSYSSTRRVFDPRRRDCGPARRDRAPADRCREPARHLDPIRVLEHLVAGLTMPEPVVGMARLTLACAGRGAGAQILTSSRGGLAAAISSCPAASGSPRSVRHTAASTFATNPTRTYLALTLVRHGVGGPRGWRSSWGRTRVRVRDVDIAIHPRAVLSGAHRARGHCAGLALVPKRTLRRSPRVTGRRSRVRLTGGRDARPATSLTLGPPSAAHAMRTSRRSLFTVSTSAAYELAMSRSLSRVPSRVRRRSRDMSESYTDRRPSVRGPPGQSVRRALAPCVAPRVLVPAYTL
jgi:hypothetical protein